MSLDKQLDPNKLFKVRLGQGESALRILLSANAKARIASSKRGDSSGPKTQGTIKRTLRANELVGRKAGVAINFYDMGQILDGGDWVDIPFSIPNTITVTGTDVADRSLDFSEWEELEDYLFTADPADWKTTYRKLSYESAERYGLDILDNANSVWYPVARNGSRYSQDGSGLLVSGTKWTDKGLVVPAPLSDVHFVSFGAFTFFTSETFLCRVTNTPSYAGTEVPFTLAKKANVFLVPDIRSLWSWVDGSEVIFQRDRQALQRSFWLDTVDSLHVYPLLSYRDDGTGWDNTTKGLLYDIIRGNGVAYSGVGTAPTPYAESSYPLGGTGTDIELMVSGNGLSNWEVVSLIRPEGTFLGAVEQNGQMFYFWNKDNLSGGSAVERAYTYTV